MRRILLFLALGSLCLPLFAQRGGHGGGGMHAGGGMRAGGFSHSVGSPAVRYGGGVGGIRGGYRQPVFRNNFGVRGNFGFRGLGFYPYSYPGFYGGYGYGDYGGYNSYPYDSYSYDSSYPNGYGYSDGDGSSGPPVVIVQNSPAYAPPPPPPQPVIRYPPGPQLPGAQPSESSLYLIAFQDGVIRAVLAYWAEGASLHYVTMDHEQKQVPLSAVDRSFSERLNAERNVQFRLPR